jgi:two-component system sensor histidine kinase/response regulator
VQGEIEQVCELRLGAKRKVFALLTAFAALLLSTLLIELHASTPILLESALCLGGALVGYLMHLRHFERVETLAKTIKSISEGEYKRITLDHPLFAAPRVKDALDQLNDRFEHLSRDLDEKVSDRTQQLAMAVEAADKANRAKSSFLATMSHELRTPLNGIIGMGEILLTSGLRVDQQLYVRMAKESAEGMVSIINDVLDLSKIEAGFFSLHTQPTDLEQVVSQVFRSIGVRGSMKGIEMACEVTPSPLPLIHMDPLRLRQILVNLVGNAIKFTDRGGVVVSIALEAINDNGKSRLTLSVKDTGAGIPDDAKNNLFKPFAKIGARDASEFGGSGLGLSIVRKLIDLMGGTISVESEIDRGTNFRIELPSVSIASPPQSHPEIITPKPVLLIHGDGMAARSVLNALVSYGLQIHVVKSVEAALKNASLRAGIHGAWHCAVVSEELAMEAPILTRQLAALLSGNVIATVPSDRLPEINPLLALGVKEVISRPFVPSEILSAMERLATTMTSPHRQVATSTERQLRILVSDDTSLNRMVAKMLLEQIGHQVETVSNGEETLRKLRDDSNFDLVFLDLELPDLNGKEVSKRIRERGGSQTKIPIFALTAHDANEEREACLAAGMDDCISKPISIEKLSCAVKQVTSRNTNGEPSVEIEATAVTSYSTETIDRSDLNRRYGNDAELIEAIGLAFLEEREVLQNRLLAALESTSPTSVSSAAHAIKSSAGNVSAVKLWMLADSLERSRGNLTGEEVANAVADLIKEWERVNQELIEMITPHSVQRAHTVL